MRRLAKVGALEATQSAAKEIPLPTGPVGRSREGTSGQAIGS